jgi:acyl-homoserine lactone acylase PvdQ
LRLLTWFSGALAILISVPVGLGVLAVALVAVIFATEPTDMGRTAQVPSLEGDVSVLRDTHGVPHIFAETQHDAYRAITENRTRYRQFTGLNSGAYPV